LNLFGIYDLSVDERITVEQCPFVIQSWTVVAIAEDIQYRNESAKPCRSCGLRGNLAGEKFPELFEPFAWLCQPLNPACPGG
jgi:hypothetical protein